MSDQREGPDEQDAVPGDNEIGEPIAELAELRWDAADDFARRVSGRIERRLLAGRLLDVAWTAPLTVLLELLRAPLELLTGSRRSQ